VLSYLATDTIFAGNQIQKNSFAIVTYLLQFYLRKTALVLASFFNRASFPSYRKLLKGE
jgi:hypothetical protein